MAREFSPAELEAYLDEALHPVEMAEVETSLRDNEELIAALAAINRRRDAGLHSLGEVWRRHRLSCPTREELGSFLLQALDDEQCKFIEFHLEVSACRLCNANIEDLKNRRESREDDAVKRRARYFQSSAGYLRKDE